MGRLLFLPLLVLLGAGLAACSDSPPACDDPVTTTGVEMGDLFYSPLCIEAAAGTTLEISNTGELPHTFTVNDTDLNLDVPAGEDGELVIDEVPAGLYKIICVYHPEMTAALKVL